MGCAEGRDRTTGGTARQPSVPGFHSSARSVVVFSRIGLDERNQVLHRPRRHHRVYGKQYRCAGGERDRLEGLDRTIGDLAVQGWIDDELKGSKQHGVPVGSRLCCSTHADIAAAAADVLDVELLSKTLR